MLDISGYNRAVDKERERNQAQRRFVEMPINPEMLNSFLISRTVQIDSKLPDNIFVESYKMEADKFGRGDILILVLASTEFEPVPEGNTPPRIDPSDVVFTVVQNREYAYKNDAAYSVP